MGLAFSQLRWVRRLREKKWSKRRALKYKKESLKKPSKSWEKSPKTIKKHPKKRPSENSNPLPETVCRPLRPIHSMMEFDRSNIQHVPIEYKKNGYQFKPSRHLKAFQRRCISTIDLTHLLDDNKKKWFQQTTFITSRIRKRLDAKTGQTIINSYILLKKVTIGSLGEMYVCRNLDNETEYCMKQINNTHISQTLAMNRGKLVEMNNIFLEIDFLGTIEHENIIKIHELIDDDLENRIYIIFERLRRPIITLDNTGRTTDILPEAKAREFCRCLLNAIDHLHSKYKIVHRQICPENILLNAEGKMLICNFGLSKKFSEDKDEFKNTHKYPGKIYFTPPEIFDEQLEYFSGTKADIWQCGILMFIICFGFLPFNGFTKQEVRNSILNGEIPFPDNTPYDLRCFLEGMLQKNPSERATIYDLFQHKWLTENGKLKIVEAYIPKISISED